MKRIRDLLSPEKSTENKSKQRIVDKTSVDPVVKDAILVNMSGEDTKSKVDDERIKSLLQKYEDSDSNIAIVHALFTLLAEHFENKDAELVNRLELVHKDEICQLKRKETVLNQRCRQLESRVLDLEMDKVSNILMISGVPEHFTDLKGWFTEFCVKQLQFFDSDAMQDTVIFASRVGQPFGGRPRIIRMGFNNKNSRDYVMGRRSYLKNSGIFFDEDFPKNVAMARRRLRPIMMAAKKRNFKATLKGDKLLINGVLYGENDLDELPKELTDTAHGCRAEKEFVAFFRKEGELSNHYPSHFEVKDQPYCCNEQYYTRMMAIEFDDEVAEAEIMKTENPGKMLAVAKKIRGFDQSKWNLVSKDVMKTGLRAKFTQHKKCQEFLRNTGDRRLIEANPNDKIWSAGIHMFHENINNHTKWPGTNWLGDCLEEIRTELFK